MKKKFVKVSLFCALAATASTAFVACADYDDDIKNLQEQVDANKTLAETLDAQIQDLKKAQETANAEIQAAKDAAAAAQEAAGKANELAKQAAAEAKAEAIEEATKLVEALKADIEAKNYATTEELNAAITTVNSTIASIQKDLNDKIDGLDDEIDGLKVSVNDHLAWIEELQQQMVAVQKFKDLIDKNTVDIAGLKEDLADLEDKLTGEIKKAQEAANKYTDDEISKLRNEMEAAVSSVNTYLVTLLGEKLRSLVFVPNLYVDGIEAVEYGYMRYYFTEKDNSKTQDITSSDAQGETLKANILGVLEDEKGEVDYKFDTDKAMGEYDPVITLDYHVNPSSAKVEEDGLSFIDRDVEVVSSSRATKAEIKFSKEGFVAPKNGVMTVGMQVPSASLIPSQSDASVESENGAVGNPQATIFALQSKISGIDGAEDTTIVSDYAMLYASRLELQAIAFSTKNAYKTLENSAYGTACAAAVADKELYQSPYKAIEQVPTLLLKWDDKEGIDLKSKLSLHYLWGGNTSKAGNHKEMTVEEAENKWGFSFEFRRVDYEVGVHKTKDSRFLELYEKNGQTFARACFVDSDENSLYGTQNQASVGKQPLVQVLVRDAEQNIILDGYIKFEIVREIDNKMTNEFDKGNVKFSCNAKEVTLTWSEVTYELLGMTAVTSKEEFDALYKLDVNVNGFAYQYKCTDPEKLTFDNIDVEVGSIKAMDDHTSGTTTNVLKWTLDECEQQYVYNSKADAGQYDSELHPNGEHAKTVYVRYVNRNTTAASKETPAIYLPLTVGVAKPQGTVTTKLGEGYWYGTNYERVHVNVNQPVDNGTTVPFLNNLNAVWKANQPNFGMKDKGFDSYAEADLEVLNGAAGGYKYYFRPENNNVEIYNEYTKTTYQLSVGSASVYDKCESNKEYKLDGNKLTSDIELSKSLNAKLGVYNNKALYANVKGSKTKVKIAEIVNGKDFNGKAGQPVMEYIKYNEGTPEYEVSSAVLNAYPGSSEKALTAMIGIVAYAKDCNTVLSLTGNSYPARFLRPINVEGIENAEFTDAETNGSVINVMDLFNYTDWRGIAFLDGETNPNAWFFGFYGVKSATVLGDEITTTLDRTNATDKSGLDADDCSKLKDVSTFVEVYQEDNSNISISNVTESNAGPIYTKVRNGFGVLRYDNNNNTVKTFWLRVPVKFVYTWGEIIETVDIKVNNTLGN